MKKREKQENAESLEQSNIDSSSKRTAVIILEVAVLISLVAVIAVVFGSRDSRKNVNPVSKPYVYHSVRAEGTTRYKSSLTTSPDGKNPTGSNGIELDFNVDLPNGVAQLADPSGWTTAEILKRAGDAINQTKQFKGQLSVTHSESFVANVTECTGGSIVKSLATMMMGWVAKPVSEELSFSNGQAVNSESETVPLLLPKRGDFSLTESGLTSASVSISNNQYVIKLGIVPESVGMYDVPTHNAAGIGYLDVANYDISFLTVDSADITYKGSSIVLRINSQGYVTSAEYRIPLNVKGSGHRGSLSGSLTFDGEQTEIWKFNW